MTAAPRRMGSAVGAGFLLVAAWGCCASAWGAALTPQSPEVKSALAKAAKFLETKGTDSRVGGNALVGLALLKHDTPPDHPAILRVKKEIESAIQGGWLDSRDNSEIYSLGLSLLFYAELDPFESQRAMLQKLTDALVRKQKANGAWGYPYEEVGDTSMTQFAVIGLWIASRSGVNTPEESWVRVCNWLLRTQQPDGGFVYHPADGAEGQLAQVDSVGAGRHGVSAGAAGSLYLCLDHFGLRRIRLTDFGGEIPKELRRVPKPEEEAEGAAGEVPKGVDAAKLAAAAKSADRWMESNYTIRPANYQHYYLYALERYETVKGGGPAKWYDDGARMLVDSQKEDGSWGEGGATGLQVDTAFGMLFLLRSMERALKRIELLGDGTLVGGRGLPQAGGDVRLRLGAVVPKPLAGPAEDLLSKMEDAAAPEYLRAVEGFEELATTADVAELNRHAVKLRALTRAEDPAARRAAVKALGRTANLDHVPTLIYALTDPDPQIAQAAEDALRRLSRRFDGVGEDLSREQIVERWKDWYRSVRPNAQFDN